MPKNTESLNRSLFDLLHSKGFDPTMLDTTGKEIPTPEEAEVFQFNFIKDGEDYGKVTMSIDGLHKLVIYFSDEVANSEKEESHGEDESWYKILNQLKRFAQKYQLSFELRNVDHLKHDMAKREYMKKHERISEGYYPMGKKASYSDAVPSVKIILQHTRQIEEGEQRYRNIAKIFLENQDGERFLAPTTKPGVARVYGRLIAEGDKPHGERWNHVTSLVEEYQKMGAFVRATRNGQFNESAQRLVNEGINHYQGLRETLSRMTGHRGYNTYFESWTPSLMEDETEETNLNELFVQETLDPRIESVMPILNKLQKKVAEMKEVGALAEWADNIIDEGAAVDAYMAGKSPALAHFADQLDNDIEEDDLDEQRFPDNSNSTAKRDIVVTNLNDLIKDPRQAHEPKRHGPDNSRVKVATRVMPSDKAKQMNRFKTGEEEVSEQKWPDTSTSLAKRGKVVANVTDLIKDPRLAHEPKREGPNNPKLKMATKVMPSINKDKPEFGTKLKDPKNYLPVKAGVFGPYEVEEGGLGDLANKVGGAVKKGANAVLNKLGHDDDTELLRKIQKDAGIPVTAQHGKPNMGHSKDEEFLEGTGQQLSVQQLATISDEALDNAYHYGRSTPGNSFGWQANLKSAQYAKQMIDKGVTDIEAISDAIHKGWNVTAQAFVQKPEQFDDTAKLQAAGKLEAKLQQRAELMKKNYSQLPEDEKEKDRVVARALLQALKGQQGVAEDDIDESALQAYLGDKKYGKDGMDALRKAGQDHASEKKMQNIRAKYSSKEEGVAEGEGNKYGSQENWDSLRKDIKSQYPYKKGTTVTVPHKGKLVNGEIVRYEAGEGGYSPAYVVDIGEYESIMVEPNKVRQGVAEAKADPTGSWVVYNGSKLKKFKTREGAKAYAEKNGGTVASSEYYHDKIQKQGVAEGIENNPVANEIINFIMKHRPDLLKYGADRVGDAIDRIASRAGNIGHINSDNIGKLIKQVEYYVTSNNNDMYEGKRNLKCVCKTHGTLQCPVHTPKDIDVLENNKNKKA